VEQAYKDNLTSIYLDEVEEDIVDSHKQLWEDIKNGDGESLADYLEIQFGEIPYYLNLTNKKDRWKIKQTIFLKLLEYMGFKTKGEVAISQVELMPLSEIRNMLLFVKLNTHKIKESLLMAWSMKL